MEKLELIALAKSTALMYGLEPSIVCGIVEQESNWNTWGFNAEPKYKYCWNVRLNTPFRPLSFSEVLNSIPPLDFPSLKGCDKDAEYAGQKTSYGLMQVMGAVAREEGFKGIFLTELCDAVTGLNIGCKHLRRYLDRFDGDYRKAIVAYNGGPGAAIQEPPPNIDYFVGVMEKAKAYM